MPDACKYSTCRHSNTVNPKPPPAFLLLPYLPARTKLAPKRFQQFRRTKGMADNSQPLQGEEREVSSGLLLSVDPLPGTTGYKLSADDTDTTDVSGDDTDTSDADGTDGGDSDDSDDGSDADGTDVADADGTDTGADADGADPLGIASDKGDSDGTDSG